MFIFHHKPLLLDCQSIVGEWYKTGIPNSKHDFILTLIINANKLLVARYTKKIKLKKKPIYQELYLRGWKNINGSGLNSPLK